MVDFRQAQKSEKGAGLPPILAHCDYAACEGVHIRPGRIEITDVLEVVVRTSLFSKRRLP
jgi:hypothetical protein